MMKYVYVTFLIGALCCLTNCSRIVLNPKSSSNIRDIIMKEGMIISIQNPDCFSLSVRAGKELERFYTWNNGTRSVNLIPRDKKWAGAYGAYFPGTGHHWKEHDGITRLIAEESVLNFDNYAQLICALSEKKNKCKNKKFKYEKRDFDFETTLPGALYQSPCSAYTNDGLYFSVKKAKGPGDGGTLYVIIHQIKLKGL